MNPEYLLEVDNLSKAFHGIPALKAGAIKLRSHSIHALCGGNGAGKSTFLSILVGLLKKDGGTIRLKGEEIDIRSPEDALSKRIAIITQELSPVPEMMVAENIFLGREPRKNGVFVDFAHMTQQARTLLQRLRFDIDPGAKMRDLSLAQVQLVEIARAFSQDAQVLIMDEPTSAIGEHETQLLFDAVRSLAREGAGIIYVTHRMNEVFDLTEDYTVFRDGAVVETGKVSDIDRDGLVRAIVGRELRDRAPNPPPVNNTVCLAVDGLTRRGEFENIKLSVTRGEIVGVYGLMGSGRTEFLNCVYGLTRPDAGIVAINDKMAPIGNPAASIEAGMALITEDRKESGLIMPASVAMNVSLSSLRRLAPFLFIRKQAEDVLVKAAIERLRVKAPSSEIAVEALSGGNQQKVVLARCLATKPVLLICDEPTRGVDEGAKREIYALLGEFASRGGAVLFVSSEAPELLGVSHRITVFKKGRQVAWMQAAKANQEMLLHAAS